MLFSIKKIFTNHGTRLAAEEYTTNECSLVEKYNSNTLMHDVKGEDIQYFISKLSGEYGLKIYDPKNDIKMCYDDVYFVDNGIVFTVQDIIVTGQLALAYCTKQILLEKEAIIIKFKFNCKDTIIQELAELISSSNYITIPQSYSVQ